MFRFKLIIHKFLNIHIFKFLYITVSEIQSPPVTYDGHVDRGILGCSGNGHDKQRVLPK